jgi:DNA-binding NarL/FixJ family response regulator
MINKKYRIVILEQSPFIRYGLITLVAERERSFSFHIVHDLQELQLYMRAHEVDLVVINYTLSQVNNKLFTTIKKEYPELKWIAFTQQYITAQAASQFDEVLSLENTPDELAVMIRSVLEKDTDQSADKTGSLSDREIDVLRLLVTGYSGKEVADRLNISINTVTSHRKNISQKTGIKSLAGLTIYAVANHVITMNNLQR